MLYYIQSILPPLRTRVIFLTLPNLCRFVWEGANSPAPKKH